MQIRFDRSSSGNSVVDFYEIRKDEEERRKNEKIKSCDSCLNEESDCDKEKSIDCHKNDMKYYKGGE